MVDKARVRSSERGRRRRAKPASETMASLHGQRIIGNGGGFNPLDPAGIAMVHDAACELLAQTGLSEASSSAIQLVEAAGGSINDAGRLLFHT